MASVETEENIQRDDRDGLTGGDASQEWASFRESALAVLKPVASIKLTVVLFALAIFIVLAGTFAQVDMDIWPVVRQYFRIDFARAGGAEATLLERFREFFVWIDFQIFFPPSFFPEHPDFPKWMPQSVQDAWPRNPDLPWWMGVWFPKGWTIGAVMMLNLFAAHLVRFRVQTKGPRLTLGLATIGLGCLVTALVVMSGNDADGPQSKTLVSYDVLWRIMQVTLIAMAGLSLVYLVNSKSQQRSLRWLLGGTAVFLALTQGATMVVGPIDDSSMRILYQLIKGTLAGVVLLAGCILVFKKRAGIVLLHGGIGLVMVYDVLVGTAHVESRMMIVEGESVDYSDDIRTAELAIVDRSDPDVDWHTVVPSPLLREGQTLSDELLPFDVEVLRFFPNADLRETESLSDKEREQREQLELPEATGNGSGWTAVPVRSSSGTDTNAAVDLPAAYLRLTERESGQDLGTYLVTTSLSLPDVLTVGEQEYELGLRFRRLYKPYMVELIDAQRNDYIGTDRPRDYRSIVEITDAESGSTFKVPIWMNNPLRYAGETFYQSGHFRPGELGPGSKETTVLQVVSNTGWMIPYVSCMIVTVGMLAQFVLTLMRFLNRRFSAYEQVRQVRSPDQAGGETDAASTAPTGKSGSSFLRRCLVPTLTVLATSGLIAAVAWPRAIPDSDFQIDEFGKLPVLYQGRPQPIDSLATNALLMISDKQTFKHDTTDKDEKSKPAIHWLLDMAARPELAMEHQIFRIESLEMQRSLGLERREGNRYALNEFLDGYQKTRSEAQEAAEASRNKEQLTLIQRKLLDLHRKVIIYSELRDALTDTSSAVPTIEQMREDPQSAMRQLERLRPLLNMSKEMIAQMGLPLMVPTHLDRNEESIAEVRKADWLPYSTATAYAGVDLFAGIPASPATIELASAFAAWNNQEVKDFNKAVADYRKLLASVTPKELAPPESHTPVRLAKTDFEAYFNNLGPFNFASWLYVVTFVLVAVSWLLWTEQLNRAAFWMILVTFVLHTLALVGRIYISGRPPVTNLYSSAVFIGWAAVLFGIVLEAVYGRGTGNVLAAIVGFLTLRIAHGLAMEGDTYAVLEAVLDTQFWLATHVVCVSLGYSATFVSGALGYLYILRGVFTKSLDDDMERTLTRMNYGVLCFALFFSFVGTVLGGLWADDSWGRFWGWDPKENGALIIVLWNALVLHARWDGMIKGRGLAVLTVLGSIVVSWSWFGTNELGVGLHTYGFTEGRLMKLALFCLADLAITGVGCLPKSVWRSYRTAKLDSPAAA